MVCFDKQKQERRAECDLIKTTEVLIPDLSLPKSSVAANRLIVVMVKAPVPR